MTLRHSLALVPARGGSKGIPGKNLAEIGGRPLIAWTIAAALASGLYDRVVVSTDDQAIAAASAAAGAEVPFLRPAELASDASATLPVVNHALGHFAARGEIFDDVTVLQPTSPFRSASDINAAATLLSGDADTIVSVAEAKPHPAWCYRIEESGEMVRWSSEPTSTQRQDLAKAFAPNGAIYIARTDHLAAGGGLLDGKCMAYVMPSERSLDIDTAWDLHVARLMFDAEQTFGKEAPYRKKPPTR